MPRSARLDFPDLLQHVIVRGVNRCDIFVNDEDRRSFLKRLSALLIDTETECFAWSLMTNHAHLLLRPRKTPLARLMRRLLTGYAISFNHRHQRSGHLFQSRYKSIVCDEDSYLHELLRYIHLNPLRAGLVSDMQELDSYPWAGHAALMGKSVLTGQSVDAVLLLFAQKVEQGRRQYHAFVADGVEMGQRADLVGGRKKDRSAEGAETSDEGPDARILGDGDFMERLRMRIELAPRLDAPAGINHIVQKVCGHFALDAESLRKRNRSERIAAARAVICYLAVREAGHNGVQVGEQVRLQRAGVSHAASRGAALVKSDPDLLKLLDC